MQRKLFGLLLLGALALTACQESVSPPSSPEKPTPTFTKAPTGDPAVLAMMEDINRNLQARGFRLAVEEIDFFTLGAARPSNRIHAQPFRWVAFDARRLAQGNDITYLVATNRATTESGLTAAQTTAAIVRALDTWNADDAVTPDIVRRAYPGGDVTIFDELIDERDDSRFDDFRGRPGDPFVADIVDAGWLPRAYFEAVGGPGGGRGILAFSVTFIFQNDDGSPSDIDGDNRLDTALNEVYYNNTFGDPDSDRANRPWGIDIGGLGIDVETVGLHENGHSLGLGHFGPPPDAVMNPVYAGIRHFPFSADDAGMSAVWNSWPSD